jgi:hypothetical protein
MKILPYRKQSPKIHHSPQFPGKLALFRGFSAWRPYLIKGYTQHAFLGFGPLFCSRLRGNFRFLIKIYMKPRKKGHILQLCGNFRPKKTHFFALFLLRGLCFLLITFWGTYGGSRTLFFPWVKYLLKTRFLGPMGAIFRGFFAKSPFFI